MTGVSCWMAPGSPGGQAGLALCVMQGMECTELGAGNGPVENLWVRTKGQTNELGDAVLGRRN